MVLIRAKRDPMRKNGFSKKHKPCPVAGDKALRPPFVICSVAPVSSAHYLTSGIFEENISTFGPSPQTPFSKILVARLLLTP